MNKLAGFGLFVAGLALGTLMGPKVLPNLQIRPTPSPGPAPVSVSPPPPVATKEPSPTVQSPNPYTNAPFDSSVTKLDPKFRGVNAVKLYEALKSRGNNRKSDFETSDQYKSRIGEKEKTLVLDTIYTNSKIAFYFGDTDMFSCYDTDKKIAYFGFRMPHSDYGMHENSVDMLLTAFSSGSAYDKPFYKAKTWSEITTDLGTYEASNSFGAKAMIRQSLKVGYDIEACIADDEIRCADADIGNWAVQMDVDKAKEAKGHSPLLFIGHLKSVGDDYISEHEYHHQPLINEPYAEKDESYVIRFALEEAWVVNRDTGEIYLKVPMVDGPKKSSEAKGGLKQRPQ